MRLAVASRFPRPYTGSGLKLPEALFVLFLGSLLIDVGGGLYVKYSITLLVAFYIGVRFFAGTLSLPSHLLLEVLIFFFVPFAFAFSSIVVFGVPTKDAMSEIIPFATFIVYPLLLLIKKESLASHFSNVMVVAAGVIIFTAALLGLLHRFGYDNVISQINLLAEELRLGYIGANPHFDFFVPNVYYRWTMLLIPTSILLLNQHLRKQIFVLGAVFLSLSTAVILFSLVGVMMGHLFDRNGKNRNRRRAVLVRTILTISVPLASLAAVDYATDSGLTNFIGSKLTVEAEGSGQRLGHISSIVDLVLSDEKTLLFGMGVGSTFFSDGVNAEVVNVEVSHLNLIRQFGLLYSLTFFGYVFILIGRLILSDQDGRLLGFGLMMIFLAAGTNPLLVSPVFFTFLAVCRAYLFAYARDKNRALNIKVQYE